MRKDDLQKVVKEDQPERLERSFNGSNNLRPPSPASQGNSNTNNAKKEK